MFQFSVHVCVLLQHLYLALQNVSFIGELLHELLVSVARENGDRGSGLELGLNQRPAGTCVSDTPASDTQQRKHTLAKIT